MSSGVRFVARVKNQKTPDLTAELIGQRVLCEVKTINPSEQKMAIRLAGDAKGGRCWRLNRDKTHSRRLMTIVAGGREIGEASFQLRVVFRLDRKLQRDKRLVDRKNIFNRNVAIEDNRALEAISKLCQFISPRGPNSWT